MLSVLSIKVLKCYCSPFSLLVLWLFDIWNNATCVYDSVCLLERLRICTFNQNSFFYYNVWFMGKTSTMVIYEQLTKQFHHTVNLAAVQVLSHCWMKSLERKCKFEHLEDKLLMMTMWHNQKLQNTNNNWTYYQLLLSSFQSQHLWATFELQIS